MSVIAFLAAASVPIIGSVDADPGLLQTTAYPPGAAVCDGVEAIAQRTSAFGAAVFRLPMGAQPYAAAFSLAFDIDGEGRPLNIRRKVDPSPPPSGYAFYVPQPYGQDAALAAGWRFAPGAPRKNCTMSLKPTARPASALTRVEIVQLLTSHDLAGDRKALGAAARPSNSDCYDDGGPKPAVIIFPDRKRVRLEQGQAHWTAVDFDIDAEGKTTNLKIAASGADADMDQEAMRSVRDSRFAPQARRGCVGLFHSGVADTPAPPIARTYAARVGDDCDKSRAAKIPAPSAGDFPTHFARRRAAGWALVRYSIAPWGEVGDVSVVAAQPAEAFGQAAAALVRRGKGETGKVAVGCVVPVIFSLPPEQGEPTGTSS